MVDVPGTGSEKDASRLRAVRYFSDICAAGLPQSHKDEMLARLRDLEARSDAELSELGLMREDIVDHVFRDAHFI